MQNHIWIYHARIKCKIANPNPKIMDGFKNIDNERWGHVGVFLSFHIFANVESHLFKHILILDPNNFISSVKTKNTNVISWFLRLSFWDTKLPEQKKLKSDTR